ncbi:MAG: helix-turn-helix transcriptional regulator [Acetatifactor sp.]|nr:helix-turn-helix transcriptional regulator [Acetatifactor sp.]
MKITGDENNKLILTELGQRIKDIRISRSITQRELAHSAGISFSTVVRVESGEGVNIENYMKILRILDLLPNFNLLVPEQQLMPAEFIEKKPRRQRASKRKQEREWKWGDEQ